MRMAILSLIWLPTLLFRFRSQNNFYNISAIIDFFWEKGKVQRIGALLTAELFIFNEIEQPDNGNGSDGSKSTFFKTLLPAMHHIVTHANPQLRGGDNPLEK